MVFETQSIVLDGEKEFIKEAKESKRCFLFNFKRKHQFNSS